MKIKHPISKKQNSISKINRALLYFLSACLATTFSVNSHANSPRLAMQLPTDNTLPFAYIFGIPQNHTLLGRSENSLSINTSLYNTSTQSSLNDQQKGETLILDGEIFRTEFQYTHALNANWLLSGTIPVIHQGGGILDNSIEKFHEIFGLPNGNRALRPTNQLFYFYQRNGKTLVNYKNQGTSIGDTKLRLQWLPAFSTQKQYAIGLEVDLPTGKTEYLAGSNTTDISMDASAFGQFSKFEWQASIGIMQIIGDGFLNEQREDTVYFGGAGINYLFTPHLKALVQIETHSALFNSNTKTLGKDSTQLSLGVSFKSSKKLATEIYLTEDIDTDTAPDFGFGVNFRFFL